MTDELAFFRAAAANPDDDLPRLVYADWLDEQGTEEATARAAFVRLQVRRSQLGVGHPDRQDFLKEEAAILRRFARKWNGQLHRRLHQSGIVRRVDARRGSIRWWRYHRGMVGHVKVTAEAIAEIPDHIFSLGPIECLTIHGEHDWYGPTPRRGVAPHLATLKALALTGIEGEWIWDRLTAVKNLRFVTLLDLRGVRAGNDSVRLLTRSMRRELPEVILVRTFYASDPSITQVIDPFNKWAALRPWYEDLTGRAIEAVPYPYPGQPPVSSVQTLPPQPALPTAPRPEPPSPLARFMQTIRRFGRS